MRKGKHPECTSESGCEKPAERLSVPSGEEEMQPGPGVESVTDFLNAVPFAWIFLLNFFGLQNSYLSIKTQFKCPFFKKTVLDSLKPLLIQQKEPKISGPPMKLCCPITVQTF